MKRGYSPAGTAFARIFSAACMVLAVCAVVSGAETWEDIEDFGEARIDWLKRFLDLQSERLGSRVIGRGLYALALRIILRNRAFFIE
ncbi:MAG: transposase family protein [Spirochaetales bacterium]|nr:transposase family protein [Spirochaetales bacterium]